MQDGRDDENVSPEPDNAWRPLPEPDSPGTDALGAAAASPEASWVPSPADNPAGPVGPAGPQPHGGAPAQPAGPGAAAPPPREPGAWPGYPPPGSAQPGYPPPGYTQPFYGPPSYAQPGYGQPGYGPPPASPWQAQPGTQPIWAGPAAGQEAWAPPPAGQPPYAGQPQPGQWPPYPAELPGGAPPRSWAPPPGGGYGQPPLGPRPPSRGPLGRALVYVVVAVLAAAVGAGAVFALRGGPGRAPAASSQAAKPRTNISGNGHGSGINERAVAAKVTPGMVNITSRLALQRAVFEGTGMVLTANGLVLTNNHVINGATATSLSVTLAGTSRRYNARVVGWDQVDDVALLQLQGASGLKTVQVGNSKSVKVGDQVVALGNAGGTGGTPTVTQGRITGLNKTITASDAGSGASETLHNMLQINALIQPGDSGGPLANAAGQVIGMNTAANTQNFGPGNLMGYSIPIDKALRLERQMALHQASKTIHIGQPPFIGIAIASTSAQATSTATSPQVQLQQLRHIAANNGPINSSGRCLPNEIRSPVPHSIAPATSGALIGAVFCGTPIVASGAQAGDVIVAVNGQAVTSAASLHTIISNYHPGDTVSLTWVDLSGHKHTSPLRLAAGPVR
jgi:S1-C subfamily serine protease